MKTFSWRFQCGYFKTKILWYLFLYVLYQLTVLSLNRNKNFTYLSHYNTFRLRISNRHIFVKNESWSRNNMWWKYEFTECAKIGCQKILCKSKERKKSIVIEKCDHIMCGFDIIFSTKVFALLSSIFSVRTIICDDYVLFNLGHFFQSQFSIVCE